MPVPEMDISHMMDNDLTGDGQVSRVTDIVDTTMYNRDKAEHGGGLQITPAGLSDQKVQVNDKAHEMKKNIAESIESGYSDLSRGTKIRILQELMKKLQQEGEERRQAAISVRRK